MLPTHVEANHDCGVIINKPDGRWSTLHGCPSTMADRCIPANPDIAGIGVRAAIYAQNLLCFAPVVAHLWDGEVSSEEMSGIKDQSIGMLAIAFAILITTVIQATAKTSGRGQSITNFHTAIILDLSWMNNTSTFIWFLLYAHRRSKNKDKLILIPATWSDWFKLLLSPLRRLGACHSGASLERAAKGDDYEGGNQGRRRSSDSRYEGGHDTKHGVAPEKPSKMCISLIQRSWDLILQEPVLTLGSIHLTLMSSVGIWLWSSPSNFGTPIPCYPSLAIVGGAVRFSSQAMHMCSLLMYSLLLIPGINLIPGFFFLLSPHILYNKSRRQQLQFWTRCRHILDSMRRGLRNTLQTLRLIASNALPRRHAAPLDEECQVGDNHPPIPSRAQFAHPPSGKVSSLNPVNLTDSMLQGANDHNPIPSQEQSVHSPPSGSSTSQSPSSDADPAFLIVGLVCLAVINVIFLVDIELTLSRNKHIQSREADEWGFGQVLALLLLVVPLRDFAKSIIDIQKRSRHANRKFVKHLRDAIRDDTFEGHDFQSWIEQGANLNAQVEGICFVRSHKDIH